MVDEHQEEKKSKKYIVGVGTLTMYTNDGEQIGETQEWSIDYPIIPSINVEGKGMVCISTCNAVPTYRHSHCPINCPDYKFVD
jgi:hypothetical protein